MSRKFDKALSKVPQNVKDEVDNYAAFLYAENESTLGQTSATSIADNKLIEKPQGSDAPRSSDQKDGSDPIEKMTDTERECSACWGEGYFDIDDDKDQATCNWCNGKGTVPKGS